MTLEQLASALGGDLNGRWINIPGPGHSKTDRSLGFSLEKAAPAGIRTHSFAGDDEERCREHILGLLEGKPSVQFFNGTAPETDEQRERKKVSALDIWHQSTAQQGTQVETYLRARGCPLSQHHIEADAIRFHPACPFGTLRVPAMIGLMRNPETNQPTGIHRTALRDDGRGKRNMPDGSSPKRMLGIAKGAVVKLQIEAPRMGIAEGIETALSASLLFDQPVWAALSTNGIRNFPLLKPLQFLSIFADNDEAGLAASKECARRYALAGINGSICAPLERGADWNNFSREGIPDNAS
ncbi:DUF7146 domain-containing protein [Microbaculum sp. FT89]|uniref:DUF7146 domain-containing protein n=1 Tax=Microbaculum sp. FT89 TaxID=3447298 RepID=UPI003F535691